jgi:histidine triad (HIT) family protein
MSECLFCKIVSGSIPSRKVYEDDETLAFLDIFPANRGHTLVIPKKHSQDIHDTDAAIYGVVARSAKKVADLLQTTLRSEGTSIFQMSREAGWQTVFHLHIHVIPRWSGDNLHKPWDIKVAADEELEEVLRKVQGL